MVSVIIPTYNRAGIIKKSIDSVLSQTYDDLELIIVDDGSTDETKELISSYKDNRIKYYSYMSNKGVVYARNYGMKMASGDYIAFQDSDDIWHKDKLEKQIKAMEKDDSVGFCYSRMQYTLDSNSRIVLPQYDVEVNSMSGDIFGKLLYDNLVACPCLIMKKECYDKIGGYDAQFTALEDYDYALRLAKEYKALFLDDILVDANMSSGGVSSNSTNYLVSSCYMLGKYKKDYLETDTFNHRLEIILRDAEILNVTDNIVKMLEILLE